MATLTGASRVAMGIEVPSFFCNNDELGMELIDSSQKLEILYGSYPYGKIILTN